MSEELESIENMVEFIEREKPKRLKRKGDKPRKKPGRKKAKKQRKRKKKTGPKRIIPLKDKWKHMPRKMSYYIPRIFDFTQPDQSYITNNKGLLWRHISFINEKLKYTKELPYKLENSHHTVRYARPFYKFETFYPCIYKWWMHIIKSCLDPNYPFYKFIGAKGITPTLYWLDAKKFCAWALRNGLNKDPFTYNMYLVRKNKSNKYDRNNVIISSERELHNSKNISDILRNILLIRKYEEYHHPSVSYMTFYTRYYVYDMDADDARTMEYKRPTSSCEKQFGEALGFSPTKFYDGAATEESCTKSEFLSRIHGLYLCDDVVIRPYELLKPEFSVRAETQLQGKISYKEMWDRNCKEQKSNYNPYISKDDNVITSTFEEDDVYNYHGDSDVYSK